MHTISDITCSYHKTTSFYSFRFRFNLHLERRPLELRHVACWSLIELLVGGGSPVGGWCAGHGIHLLLFLTHHDEQEPHCFERVKLTQSHRALLSKQDGNLN